MHHFFDFFPSSPDRSLSVDDPLSDPELFPDDVSDLELDPEDDDDDDDDDEEDSEPSSMVGPWVDVDAATGTTVMSPTRIDGTGAAGAAGAAADAAVTECRRRKPNGVRFRPLVSFFFFFFFGVVCGNVVVVVAAAAEAARRARGGVFTHGTKLGRIQNASTTRTVATPSAKHAAMNPAPMAPRAGAVRPADGRWNTTFSTPGIGGSVDGRASRPMEDATIAAETIDALSVDASSPGNRSVLKQGWTAGSSNPATCPVPARHAHTIAPGTSSTHSAWRGHTGHTPQVRGDDPAAHCVHEVAATPE